MRKYKIKSSIEDLDFARMSYENKGKAFIIQDVVFAPVEIADQFSIASFDVVKPVAGCDGDLILELYNFDRLPVAFGGYDKWRLPNHLAGRFTSRRPIYTLHVEVIDGSI